MTSGNTAAKVMIIGNASNCSNLTHESIVHGHRRQFAASP